MDKKSIKKNLTTKQTNQKEKTSFAQATFIFLVWCWAAGKLGLVREELGKFLLQVHEEFRTLLEQHGVTLKFPNFFKRY